MERARIGIQVGMNAKASSAAELQERVCQLLIRNLRGTVWGQANQDRLPTPDDIIVPYWRDAIPPRIAAMRSGLSYQALREALAGKMRAVMRGIDVRANWDDRGRPLTAWARLIDRFVHETVAWGGNLPVPRTCPGYPTGVNELAQIRLKKALGSGAACLIGFSLGSAIAYQLMVEAAETVRVPHLITLGSPLGVEQLVMRPLRERLHREIGLPFSEPLPWPNNLERWTSVVAEEDVLAAPVLRLSEVVHPRIEDVVVSHGTLLRPGRVHSLSAYLKHSSVLAAITAAIDAHYAKEAP